ncbi:hypothetical protein SLUN_14690 [Streptomyces lunaelactis]|uniref:DUF262 domain-containing protein n=1 Tax=Streptomyces lunaelactis TaxID=1535768 RepID=A0A2R4T283_9ACTN|nr:DUF262 domain-containing protein [Streptomyces lunaelactis]AVZ73248.1 hypothetical protein SLUN_14690 [Streptomyces lunaelactis]NUK70469.1 DUF262 domain-containing protein [Streptomyces lunaelactis]NUK81800.1 DUF262 domain-containing protein [Streptomyces lunaelactis]NUK86021.1 DUF262 domain-containing protein [Streptomyces lunaelactis]
MAIIKHAARQTLGQLIGANNPPVEVPNDSQRQYAWGKREVDTYWSDIQKFMKARRTGSEASAEYFIGPIVTITDDKVTSRSLLDGQQRLTTSTILIAAIRDILGKMASTEARVMANNIQRDYIARKDGRHSRPQHFLTLSLFDRDFFRDFIQDWNETTGKVANTEKPSRPSHKLIQDASALFHSHIASALDGIPMEDDRLDWLDELKDCLVKGLVFVEVQTPTSSDANEVFETINSRGKDLSTVDLVRNFLMEKSRDDDEKNRVNTAWRSLLDGFERREDIEKFLRHFWVARHGDVRSHSLYTTIRADLTQRFELVTPRYEVRTFAAELQNASGRYLELITSGTGLETLDNLLDEIKALGADASYPLLLAVSERSDYSEMATVTRALISYYVRWTVVGRRESTLLEEKLFDLAKQVNNGGHLTAAVQQIIDWTPDDEAFQSDFEQAPIPKSTQARYLLTKIEQHLRREAGVDDVVVASSSAVHVEHIYPQSPEAELRLEDHPAWVNRLGNQTLLHGRKNRAASNKAHPEKVDAYSASSLLITQDTGIDRLWDSTAGRWRIRGIEERQADLAKIAIDVWPREARELPS